MFLHISGGLSKLMVASSHRNLAEKEFADILFKRVVGMQCVMIMLIMHPCLKKKATKEGCLMNGSLGNNFRDSRPLYRKAL